MPLDIAISTDTNDYIDPDRAYDLYWAGIIKSKKNFQCPGTNCCAQVTCANLDKDLQSMKVVPHFKVYGSHSSKCEIFNNIPLNIAHKNSAPIKEERRAIDESVVDLFLLERPASYYDEKTSTPAPNEKQIERPKLSRKNRETTLRENGSIGTIYSVRSVVSRYIRYKKDGSAENRRINILGKDVHYNRVFKCIWEQDLDDLPKYPIIYYGWAFVNRLPSGLGYQIKFKKNFKKGNEEYTPTIMIADRLIDSYKIKKLVTTRLDRIKKQAKPEGFVFVYGKPKTNTAKSGNKYANFEVTNLDMIDINYDCPLPKEYNK